MLTACKRMLIWWGVGERQNDAYVGWEWVKGGKQPCGGNYVLHETKGKRRPMFHSTSGAYHVFLFLFPSWLPPR